MEVCLQVGVDGAKCEHPVCCTDTMDMNCINRRDTRSEERFEEFATSHRCLKHDQSCDLIFSRLPAPRLHFLLWRHYTRMICLFPTSNAAAQSVLLSYTLWQQLKGCHHELTSLNRYL